MLSNSIDSYRNFINDICSDLSYIDKEVLNSCILFRNFCDANNGFIFNRIYLGFNMIKAPLSRVQGSTIHILIDMNLLLLTKFFQLKQEFDISLMKIFLESFECIKLLCSDNFDQDNKQVVQRIKSHLSLLKSLIKKLNCPIPRAQNFDKNSLIIVKRDGIFNPCMPDNNLNWIDDNFEFHVNSVYKNSSCDLNYLKNRVSNVINIADSVILKIMDNIMLHQSLEVDNIVGSINRINSNQAFIENNFNNDGIEDSIVSYIPIFSNISSELSSFSSDFRNTSLKQIFKYLERRFSIISKDLNKHIDLVLSINDINIDRAVIDLSDLYELLSHIIENEVCHGSSESIEERIVLGKNETPKILINVYEENKNIYIVIEDDGPGINIGKIKEDAVSKGYLNNETTYTNEQILDSILLPNISTYKEEYKEYAGFGFGMTHAKVQALRAQGELKIDTEENKGTKFILKLPKYIDVFYGCVVRIEGKYFVIPSKYIQNIFIPNSENWIFSNTKKVSLKHINKEIPVLNLSNFFNFINGTSEKKYAVLIECNGKSSILLVDNFRYTKEFISINGIVKREDISIYTLGWTITNLSKIGLVLDIEALLKA